MSMARLAYWLMPLFLLANAVANTQSTFVNVKSGQFILRGKPYYYVGANYWYAGLLGNDESGKQRLKKELDFLHYHGVSNLRVLSGAEGTGQINGVPRVEPPLQPKAGAFNKDILKGLDFLLVELNKRQMKAIIFLSNNWEWSGGFLQYLNWNGLISDTILKRKLNWNEMRDYVSKFYSCGPCRKQYKEQVKIIVSRVNSITGKKYKDDPAIMSWEIANEPRPMRPAAIPLYEEWISNTAAYIKSLDKNHLVTTGSEGEMGSETLQVFKDIHSDKNIDYATIHIWPKNWSWFRDTTIAGSMDKIKTNTLNYISKHKNISREINKPLVIEEFGLPRDNHSFDLSSSTSLRDDYYRIIFSELVSSVENKDVIGGANFWAFGGIGRPSQLWWKKGNDWLGDPPMEEQGLNSVFDTDSGTWDMINSFAKRINRNEKGK